MRIGAFHQAEAAEGRHEHEQGRTWEMKIRHHHVDCAKAVTGRNENRGLAGPGTNKAVLLARALQHTQRGGPDGDNAPAVPTNPVEGSSRLGAHTAPLLMHAMRVSVLRLDG